MYTERVLYKNYTVAFFRRKKYNNAHLACDWQCGPQFHFESPCILTQAEIHFSRYVQFFRNMTHVKLACDWQFGPQLAFKALAARQRLTKGDDNYPLVCVCMCEFTPTPIHKLCHSATYTSKHFTTSLLYVHLHGKEHK